MQGPRQFRVTAGINDEPVLAAGSRLAALLEADAHFAARGYRHPLAIYNVSLSRISERGQRFAVLLHQFFSEARSLGGGPNEIRARIDEQLELLVYALDAHIDDCELILKLCFKSDREYAKSPAVRAFKKAIKSIRRPTSVLCNALKHNHQRVRFFESEFHTIRGSLVLLGFFLERASKDGIHPDPNFLGPNKKVISCVGFLWSSIIGIIEISLVLASALSISTSRADTERADYRWNEEAFKQLILSTALLPFYMFDDDSPFQTINLALTHDSASSPRRDAVGSFLDPITAQSELVGIGSWRLNYVGDGVTKTFSIAIPAKASFHSVQKKGPS